MRDPDPDHTPDILDEDIIELREVPEEVVQDPRGFGPVTRAYSFPSPVGSS